MHYVHRGVHWLDTGGGNTHTHTGTGSFVFFQLSPISTHLPRRKPLNCLFAHIAFLLQVRGATQVHPHYRPAKNEAVFRRVCKERHPSVGVCVPTQHGQSLRHEPGPGTRVSPPPIPQAARPNHQRLFPSSDRPTNPSLRDTRETRHSLLYAGRRRRNRVKLAAETG